MKETTRRFMGEGPWAEVPGKDFWGHLEQSHYAGGQVPVSRDWRSAKQSFAPVRAEDEGDVQRGIREGTKLHQM